MNNSVFLTKNEIMNLSIAANNPNLESHSRMDEFLSDINQNMVKILPDGIVVNFDDDMLVDETKNILDKNKYIISRVEGSSFYNNNYALAA